MFMDLRAELLCLDFDSTGVVAESRALVDWNKRSGSRLWPIPTRPTRMLTVLTGRPLLCWLWQTYRIRLGRLETRLFARY
jgi:hypothetical protein